MVANNGPSDLCDMLEARYAGTGSI
jgi:hypothetical protein